MSSRNDLEYLTRRRDECSAKAESAIDPGIARIHREFAERYARVIDGDQGDSGARSFWHRAIG